MCPPNVSQSLNAVLRLFQNLWTWPNNTSFFPILQIFAPLNDVRMYIAWSWKTTLIMWIFFYEDDIQLQIQVPPPPGIKYIETKYIIGPTHSSSALHNNICASYTHQLYNTLYNPWKRCIMGMSFTAYFLMTLWYHHGSQWLVTKLIQVHQCYRQIQGCEVSARIPWI